jgi:phytoene dehydrogenase-like protein
MSYTFSPDSYKRTCVENSYDAIVIGSGAGGLTAAVLLAKHAGKRVLVLERHYTAGGFTHVFKRPGFEWDVGLHYIGQVQDAKSAGRRMFDHLTDGSLQWVAMPDVYDRIFIGDRQFDFVAGIERFRARMKSYFPSEKSAIDTYVKTVSHCVRSVAPYFVEKLVPPFISATLGSAMRWPYLRYASRTTGEVLDGITQNPELKAVLAAQWGDYGLPPAQSSFGIHAVIAAHYFGGASYPIGGAGAILETMAPAIEAFGGRLLVDAEVKAILVESGRAIGVRMADGREFRAPVVVSDAGASTTFNRLLPADVPELASVRKSIAAIPPSSAHIALYLGLQGTSPELGLTGTQVWVCPSNDHDGNFKRFVSDPGAAFPSVFISSPSAKDPEFNKRFPGHSTIEVITFVPYSWFERWDQTRWHHREPDYESFKHHFESRLLEIVYDHFPLVRGRVMHSELSTPQTTRHFMNYSHGEIYGLAHTPERFSKLRLGPRTPIESLYLTGQDIATCGVTGAIAGGFMAASAILRRNMFSVINEKKARVISLKQVAS